MNSNHMSVRGMSALVVAACTLGYTSQAAALREQLLDNPCGDKQCPQPMQIPCAGDTRGDKRCNHDQTHRVCAKIGDADTSFFEFTGQRNWCQTKGYYGGAHGAQSRCPPENPTWCICKWATAQWIKGEGCNDSVQIDCDATDICATEQGLYFSYQDFSVDLKPAHECVERKCKSQWESCEMANAETPAKSKSKSSF